MRCARQVDALAGLAAHALVARSSGGEIWPAITARPGCSACSTGWPSPCCSPRPARARRVRRAGGSGGSVSDFRIVHVSDGFRDPAGRTAAELTGQSLIEAYPWAAIPAACSTGRLRYAHWGTAARDRRGDRHGRAARSGRRGQRPAGQAARRRRDQPGGTRPSPTGWPRCCSTRSGSAGSAAGKRTWPPERCTGPSRCSRCSASGPGEPVRLAELDDLVAQHDDRAGVESFRARLLRDKVPTAAIFRIVQARRREHPAGARVRRAGHQLVRRAGRHPRRLPGCLRPLPHRAGAGRDPGPADRHRGTGRGRAPAGPAPAAGDHAALVASGRGGRPGRGGQVPPGRPGPPGQRRLVRHRAAAIQAR